MSSKSKQTIDIIQKTFDDKYTKKWIPTSIKEAIFLKMYIQETYNKILYYTPFTEIEITYNDIEKTEFFRIRNYSKKNNILINFLKSDIFHKKEKKTLKI